MTPRRIRSTLLIAAAAALLGACGGSRHGSASTHRPPASGARPLRSRTPQPSNAQLQLGATRLGSLPAPLEDPASATLADGRVVLLGGLTAQDTSTGAAILLSGGSPKPAGAITAQHDAQAARLGSFVYVFGGGGLAELDHILRYDPASGAVTQVGALPTAASDVAVAAIGDTAYVVGGYDGTNWLDTILAWTPGGVPRVAGRLPAGLRYAAVAAVGDRLIIAGGTEEQGPTNAIESFDPATGSVSRLGSLPVALTHASAVTFGGRVVILGGRRALDGDQTSTILSIDPQTGAVRIAGHLPGPLSDTGAAASTGEIIVAGGDDGSSAQSAILAVSPAAQAAEGAGGG